MAASAIQGVGGAADLELITSTSQALDVFLKGGSPLVPAAYDYISLSYTGANLTTVVYKTGGAGGTTVATLTLAYSGSDLISVTKT